MESKGILTLSRISTYNGYAIQSVLKVYNPYDKRWHLVSCKTLECNFGDKEKAYTNSILIATGTLNRLHDFMRDDNGYHVQVMRINVRISSQKIHHTFITHGESPWNKK